MSIATGLAEEILSASIQPAVVIVISSQISDFLRRHANSLKIMIDIPGDYRSR
jgi:hypothetical protein